MNCPKCNAPLTGKFCGKCGYKVPSSETSFNCKNCGAPIKPNAKFCGICGASVTDSSVSISSASKCNVCGVVLKPNAKFCGSCGEPVNMIEPSKTKADDSGHQKLLSKVGNRIFWEVQHGELALRINESQFLQYDDATGIIINDGIHTILKSNGEVVAELNSGIYDFIDKKELDTALNRRTGGATNIVRRGFRFFTNLILGTRVKDKIEDQPISGLGTQPAFNRVVDDLKKGAVFSATMVLERGFPLIFEFDNVQTKFLDAKVAVHAFFKITDFSKFSSYYLTDKSLVSFDMVRNELTDIIKTSIANVLVDFEQENVQLPEPMRQKIFTALKQIDAEILNGVSIDRIVTVTSNNEDLERLRGLSRELYLSEKELEYQGRLAEFRNRLTLQVNSQKLNDARNEVDFEQQMNEINKDGLLTKDDFDKFLMVVAKEKLIRESKNEEEIEIALNDIRKTGLLREEDMQILVRSIEERKEDHQRDRIFSIELLQLDHIADIDRKQLEWEYEIGNKRIQIELDRKRRFMEAQIGFTVLDIEQATLKDNYGDTRRDKDFDFDIKKKKTQIEIDKEEMEAQIELLRKTSQIRQEQDDAIHKREAELIDKANAQQLAMEQKKMETAIGKLERSKDLTPEQLMAIAANENLSPEASKAFAESFSAKFSSDATKDFMDKFNLLNENRINDLKKGADDQREFMERMMNKVMDTQSTMTGHLINSQKDIKEEYHDRLNRTEDRMDNTQDKALNYTTKDNAIKSGILNVDLQLTKKECPNCKFLNDLDVNVCIECGNKF